MSDQIANNLRVTRLYTRMILAATVAVIAFTSPTPAFAINGRDAVGVCIDSTAGGARCAWNVDKNGAIDICNKSGCVHCDSAEAQCVVAAKSQPKPIRPTRPLPVGTKINTQVGSFTVTPRVHNGSILKATPSEAQK